MIERWNKRLMQVIVYFSKTGHLIALAVAFIGINVFVLSPIQSQLMALSGGVGVIDLLPWYTPEEAFQRFNVYGPEGRNLYLIAEWTGDFIYPAVYAVLFGGIVYRLGGGPWALLSLYSGFVDWIENIFISIMLVRFPVFNTGIAQIATTFTGLKWSLAFCNILMILVLSAIGIWKWVRKVRMRATV